MGSRVTLAWTTIPQVYSLVWLRRAALSLCVLILGLIALGGATRAMDAGLACPDWPLCFGQLIPDFHPQVYFEFLHRVLAGAIAILTVGFAIGAHRNPAVPPSVRTFSLVALMILAVQIVMGGLTVLKLLHFGTVTAHLGLGVAFFGCMVWIFNILKYEESMDAYQTGDLVYLQWVARAFWIVIGAVFLQILLGGLVSSNYAGLACPDWPTCHGQWVPQLDGLVGLQVLHRLGGYLLSLLIVCAAVLQFVLGAPKRMQRAGFAMVGLVFIQIIVGVFNVRLGIPPLLTVVHLVIAASIFALGLRVLFLARRLSHIA